MSAVEGTPRLILRAEGAAVLVVATLVYAETTDGGWLLFAVLFFSPDLSMLGYLGGPRVGAICYNLVHSYVLPLAFAALAFLGVFPAAAPVALILIAHIGFDRMAGYGLKYASAFGHTHLGRVGRNPVAA